MILHMFILWHILSLLAIQVLEEFIFHAAVLKCLFLLSFGAQEFQILFRLLHAGTFILTHWLVANQIGLDWALGTTLSKGSLRHIPESEFLPRCSLLPRCSWLIQLTWPASRGMEPSLCPLFTHLGQGRSE